MSRSGFFNNAEACRRKVMQRSRAVKADSDSESDDEDSVEADRKLLEGFFDKDTYSPPLCEKKKEELAKAVSARPKP